MFLIFAFYSPYCKCDVLATAVSEMPRNVRRRKEVDATRRVGIFPSAKKEKRGPRVAGFHRDQFGLSKIVADDSEAMPRAPLSAV
jgi:hypothetical protein